MTATEINKYEIAANAMFEQVDGFSGKMSAEQQRRVFGEAIFGRKDIRIDASGQGEVMVSYTACFGLDRVNTPVSFDEVARMVNGERAISF